MSIIRLIISFLILLFSVVPAFSEEQNYCRDEKMALEWEALVKKNPDDLELQRLHSLRLGICEKIAQGSLTVAQGIAMFERERGQAIQKRFEEKRAKDRPLVQ